VSPIEVVVIYSAAACAQAPNARAHCLRPLQGRGRGACRLSLELRIATEPATGETGKGLWLPPAWPPPPPVAPYVRHAFARLTLLLCAFWEPPVLGSTVASRCNDVQAAHRRLHRRGRQRAAVAALSLETLKDIGGLVVFSALPFVAVQALAGSK